MSSGSVSQAGGEGEGESGEQANSPLLPFKRATEARRSFGLLRQKQRARRIHVDLRDVDLMMEDRGGGYGGGGGVEDLDDEYLATFERRHKRQTKLVLHDAAFLVLDLLQFYALVLAIALRWPWPYDWLYGTRFLFLANLDLWEFLKMNDPAIYNSARDSLIDSSLIGFDYRWYALGWGLFLVVAAAVYVVLYAAMHYRKRYNLLLQVARLQRAYIVLSQLLAMPVGVMMAKLFHCNAEGNMDVHNATPCASGEHLAYVAVPLAVFFGLFVLLPAWLVAKIRGQVFTRRSERHEGYLQLKEAEYAHGLDFIWAIKLYHLFSSFRLFWAYYRPVLFGVKLVLLLAYAALPWEPVWQMVAFLAAVGLLLLAVLIRRPFRVTSFNVYAVLNLVCMLVLAVLGLMQNVFDADSVFFQAEYLLAELQAVCFVWAGATLLWLAYVLLRHAGCLCRGTPLWPEMSGRDLDRMTAETRRYMQALLRGRVVLEHSLSTFPLFSPVHELSRQVQIINACCREAEFLGDPVHDTLWDLLDELIEAHARLAPVSLFAESVKASVRETAREFMKLMPAFKKRLAQREYDFILMTPMKRRMLLKMYTLGVLSNGKINKTRPVDQTETVQKLYNPKESLVLQQRRIEGDDGFYEDLENAPQDMGPVSLRVKQQHLYQAQQMRRPILEEVSEDEEGEAEDEMDNGMGWLRDLHSRAESDLVSSINDRDAEDLSDMMAGIPSRPASAASVNNGSSRTRSSSLRSLLGSGNRRRSSGQQRSKVVSPRQHIAEDAEDAV